MSDIGSNYGHHSAVILLDESGDLGRCSHSSRNLLKKAREKLGRKGWDGELKSHKTKGPAKVLILEGIAKLDCEIAWISFEKDKLPSTLRTNKHLLYLTACGSVLRELFLRTSAKKLYVVMDKYYSKKEERDRLEKQIRALLAEDHAGYFIPQLEVSQYDSLLSKELQVHDFVVGAIFQHVERNVDTYINIIKDKIIYGKEL